MRSNTIIIALVGIISALTIGNVTARELQIAGSSTVLPFASAVAEQFGEAHPEFPTPVVASGGTGAGLKQFCAGVGEDTIDIANASRKMKDAEIEACKANGVTDIREVQFGYDGIVLATDKGFGAFNVTPLTLYQAIVAKVWQNGQLVDNPFKRWNEIDPTLPDQPINLAIPAENHGTREVFQQNLITAGCKAAGVPEDQQKEACTTLRKDVVIEISGDYTETLARIQADPTIVGVFGLSFYEENADKLIVATVNGIEPTAETIVSGDYAVSRPLYFYVKGAHIGVIPGLKEYVEFFLSNDIIGEGGSLEDIGLIVQPADVTAAQLSKFEAN